MANLETKIESSIAESPPPITTTSSPLKKAPSQTPQVETPRAAELDLAGDAEPLGLGAHREDHGLGAVGVLADRDGVDAAVGELDLGRVVGDEAGAEALGLGAELVHHLRPHDALRVAGVVLDVGGVLELAAPLEALDDERLELGAGGVERGGVAGGAAADDDQVLDLLVAVRLSSSRPFGAYPDPG